METIVEIPVSIEGAGSFFSEEVMLFGKTFILEFEWLKIADSWLLHIKDTEDRLIYGGIKLIDNWPLLYMSEIFPIQLYIVSSPNNKETSNFFVLDNCTLVAELHPEELSAFL